MFGDRRPPRGRLTELQREFVRAVMGVGFIAIGALFVVGPQTQYSAGDYRGSVAFHLFCAALAIGGGLFMLLHRQKEQD